MTHLWLTTRSLNWVMYSVHWSNFVNFAEFQLATNNSMYGKQGMHWTYNMGHWKGIYRPPCMCPLKMDKSITLVEVKLFPLIYTALLLHRSERSRCGVKVLIQAWGTCSHDFTITWILACFNPNIIFNYSLCVLQSFL